MKRFLSITKTRFYLVTFLKHGFSNKLFSSVINLVFTITLLTGVNTIAKAQTVENPPQELVETISEIEKAANEQNLDELLEHYSQDFTNNDGLTYTALAEALKQIWDNYPQLNYSTQIKSWEQVGDELVANTVTEIRGTRRNKGRVERIDSTLTSRQYFQEQKLVRQEIISEETQRTYGINPPQVRVIVPEQVRVGETYNFDVIATEPLNSSLLLGEAIEERTGSDRYVNPTTIDLKPLPAGGIYKVVTAPRLADSHWLSAILVRGDGITMVTRRVNVSR